MNTLTISNTPINQDAEGRYCLNDLHKAAGDNPKHQPSNFLRLDNTKALIEEVDSSSDLRNIKAVEIIQGKGKEQGTYVVKELVYAYAMWISPAFSLKVIRAYDALVTGQPYPKAPTQQMLEMQNRLLDSYSAQVSYLEGRLKQALDHADGMYRMYEEEEKKVQRLLRARGPVKARERRDIFDKQDEGLDVADIARWAYRSTALIKAVIKAGRYV